ncbi:MAG: DNA primase small subunit domain-containing protein [Candidatus Woesearchaeota archaeon]
MDPVMLSKVLKHYKRPEVQNELVKAAKGKEAVGSFGGKGYAKRPDVLMYPNDVLEQVKNGVTSFHVSEETWDNPQRISLNMKRHEYDDLRTGWDLVLDIDCPYWEFAKITTYLFIQALIEHGISAVTLKFSGNKGFHIGVPFEAFPENVHDTPTKNLFPEGPRKIAAYLLDHISRKHVVVDSDSVTFASRFKYTLKELEEKTGKSNDELVHAFCENCGKSGMEDAIQRIHFLCTQCGASIDGLVNENYKTCPKCNVIMERSVHENKKACCSKPNIVKKFNPLSIVEVDTVLIAPRHLFRAPYSYHEKSGMISLPIPVDALMDFEKEQAEPDNVEIGKYPFLEREGIITGQAKKLFVEAFDFIAHKEQRKAELEDADNMQRSDIKREFQEVQTAIPEQFFPPCVQIISKGMTDGKKRAVFVMNNFLSSCGWEYDDIEAWFKKWNEKNPEPLRDQYFLGQVRYSKQHKKKVLPPNCDNQAYYKGFGVCKPDGLCQYVKNPANYAIKKARFAQKEAMKGKRGKKDDSKNEEHMPNPNPDHKSENDVDKPSECVPHDIPENVAPD